MNGTITNLEVNMTIKCVYKETGEPKLASPREKLRQRIALSGGFTNYDHSTGTMDISMMMTRNSMTWKKLLKYIRGHSKMYGVLVKSATVMEHTTYDFAHDDDIEEQD